MAMVDLILASIPAVPSVGLLEEPEQEKPAGLVHLVSAAIPASPVALALEETEEITPNQNIVYCVQAAIPAVVSVADVPLS